MRLVRYLLSLHLGIECKNKLLNLAGHTYILLTKCEGRIGKISARGLTSSAARSVQKRLRVDILPVKSRAKKVNKRFLTRLKKIFIDRRGHQKRLRMNGILTEHLFWLKNNFQMLFNRKIKKYERVFMQATFIVSPLQRTNCAQDHSGHYMVQCFENIRPVMEQSDWLILVIGPLAV